MVLPLQAGPRPPTHPAVGDEHGPELVGVAVVLLAVYTQRGEAAGAASRWQASGSAEQRLAPRGTHTAGAAVAHTRRCWALRHQAATHQLRIASDSRPCRCWATHAASASSCSSSYSGSGGPAGRVRVRAPVAVVRPSTHACMAAHPHHCGMQHARHGRPRAPPLRERACARTRPHLAPRRLLTSCSRHRR